MGVFSKYHDSDVGANADSVSRFGEPAYSLFSSTKYFSLHHEISITNIDEEVLYTSKSKMVSAHDKTDIVDKNDEPVAHIERKYFTLHETHMVEMADGTSFKLSNELLHIVKDITNIEGLGWQLRGNIAALNFELYDETENLIAVIGQKMLSVHDKYSIDIYQPENEQIIVAILVALQHMMKDRKGSAVAAMNSSSNN